jgi:RNA polymerase sigma-70 factor, ECF subfamily
MRGFDSHPRLHFFQADTNSTLKAERGFIRIPPTLIRKGLLLALIEPQPRLSPSPSETTADQELVAAVLRKDRKATAEFVSLYADAIYRYVRGRLIPRVDLADDLVQDVFLAAWESLATFRGTSSLRNWMLGIARHKVEDHYRGRLREMESLPENELETDASGEALVEETLDEEVLQERISKVLASLPESYSVLLLWRYWEKRSTREMAEQTGKTEKAVERLLARARAHFKQRWMSA